MMPVQRARMLRAGEKQGGTADFQIRPWQIL